MGKYYKYYSGLCCKLSDSCKRNCQSCEYYLQVKKGIFGTCTNILSQNYNTEINKFECCTYLCGYSKKILN